MVTKVCKICNKPFETESPNKQYCSEKCSKRAAKKAYRSRKMKHIMSKDYNLDKEIAQLNNRAHTLSRDLAKMFIPYKCASSEEGHICEHDLECHHINHCVWVIPLKIYSGYVKKHIENFTTAKRIVALLTRQKLL